MREIAETVARAHGVPMSLILGERRMKYIAAARQEIMYRLAKEDRWSLPRIGLFLNRDHSTVCHGRDAHAARLAEQQNIPGPVSSKCLDGPQQIEPIHSPGSANRATLPA